MSVCGRILVRRIKTFSERLDRTGPNSFFPARWMHGWGKRGESGRGGVLGNNRVLFASCRLRHVVVSLVHEGEMGRIAKAKRAL